MNYLLTMNANGEYRQRWVRLETRRGLGERIVQQRQRKGWGQGELARRLGITRHRLGKWELGLRAPGLEELMALVETLEVTFEELAFGRVPSGSPLPSAQRSAIGLHLKGLVEVLRPMLERPKR